MSDISLHLILRYQAQNNVYEVLSDVNSRQDIMDERIANLEDRINSIQVRLLHMIQNAYLDFFL